MRAAKNSNGAVASAPTRRQCQDSASSSSSRSRNSSEGSGASNTHSQTAAARAFGKRLTRAEARTLCVVEQYESTAVLPQAAVVKLAQGTSVGCLRASAASTCAESNCTNHCGK